MADWIEVTCHDDELNGNTQSVGLYHGVELSETMYEPFQDVEETSDCYRQLGEFGPTRKQVGAKRGLDEESSILSGPPMKACQQGNISVSEVGDTDYSQVFLAPSKLLDILFDSRREVFNRCTVQTCEELGVVGAL